VVENSDGTRALRVSVKIETAGDRVRFPEIPGRPEMPQELLQHLTFRTTRDGWKTSEDVGSPARISHGGDGGAVLTFEQPIQSGGAVEGVFYYRLMKDQDFAKDELTWIHHHGGNFKGYAID
jgi:hypothetical protein